MARKSHSDTGQLTFDALDELNEKLNEEPGKLYRLETKPEDVGGELLSILSKGLYTNPLDCIREYVQNAVDAKSSSVTIKITGNAVIIVDDGKGMNLSELVQARQFGLSGKTVKDNVGFRGIGIYSGYDLCKRLRITTKKSGEDHINVLLFDFEAMRTRLDADKRAESGTRKTSLFDLLTNYTQIGREMLPSTANRDRHFTIAQLEDINDVHLRELSNRDRMRAYLLENLPIDFADSFEYKDVINAELSVHVNGYTAIQITLQSDGQPDELVAKEAIPDLQTPKHGFIKTSSGQPVAYYWACLNKNRDRVNKNRKSQEQDDNSKNGKDKADGKDEDEIKSLPTSYEGFVFKVKGFTIGDRQKLRSMFKSKPQLYPWYTGEIYVLDSNVTPNAERNDFETNQAKRALMFAVAVQLEELEGAAESFQARGVAHERVSKYKTEIGQISQQVEANTQEDDYVVFSRLNDILKDLTRQKGQADNDNKKVAAELIDQAKSLQRQLRKEADNPQPEAARKKRATKSEKVEQRDQVPQFDSTPIPTKTLQDILRDAGWALEGDLGRLANIIQSSLEETLSQTSSMYRSIMSDIEAKIVSNGNDSQS